MCLNLLPRKNHGVMRHFLDFTCGCLQTNQFGSEFWGIPSFFQSCRKKSSCMFFVPFWFLKAYVWSNFLKKIFQKVYIQQYTTGSSLRTWKLSSKKAVLRDVWGIYWIYPYNRINVLESYILRLKSA